MKNLVLLIAFTWPQLAAAAADYTIDTQSCKTPEQVAKAVVKGAKLKEIDSKDRRPGFVAIEWQVPQAWLGKPRHERMELFAKVNQHLLKTPGRTAFVTQQLRAVTISPARSQRRNGSKQAMSELQRMDRRIQKMMNGIDESRRQLGPDEPKPKDDHTPQDQPEAF